MTSSYGLRQREQDRARILVLFYEFWRETGRSRWAAVELFCVSWPVTCYPFDRELQARYPRLLPMTLNRWCTAAENSDGDAASRPAERWRSCIVLDGELGKAVEEVLANSSLTTAVELHRLMSNRFTSVPPVRTFQRALAIWKSRQTA